MSFGTRLQGKVHATGRLAALTLCLLVVCGLISESGRAQTVPSSFEGLSMAASEARSSGDVEKAIHLYQSALALNPKWLEGWWFLGNLQYGSDQYQGARESLNAYIDLAPSAVAALALRGLCEYEVGAYQASLDDIQHALALGAASQPRNGQILLYHEALLLTRLGRFEEALGKYTAFVKQGISNPDVATGIGLAGLRRPLLPPEVEPADAPLLAMTGQAAMQIMSADIPEGRQAIVAVLGKYPRTQYVHYLAGYLLFSADPNQAIEEFRQELTVAPASPLAHSMLAWTLEFRGDFAEALPNAQQAVLEDPNLPMDQLVLGKALLETEDITGGLTHLSRVVELEPANIEAHLSLAKAYSKLGRKDDARHERLLCMELSGQEKGANANP